MDKKSDILEEFKIKDTSGIRACCNGLSRTYRGFMWQYAGEITDISDYKQIPDIDGHKYSKYKINTKGDVINRKNRRLMQQNESDDPDSDSDYKLVYLTSDESDSKSYYVHRLVALTFIANPDNKPVVNHIDKNRSNNDISNLEWVTVLENIEHSSGKKVAKIDINTGEVIKNYNSLSAVYRDLNQATSKLVKAVCAKRESAYGFKWK